MLEAKKMPEQKAAEAAYLKEDRDWEVLEKNREDGHDRSAVNTGKRSYGERHSGTDKDYWVGEFDNRRGRESNTTYVRNPREMSRERSGDRRLRERGTGKGTAKGRGKGQEQTLSHQR